MVTFVFYLPGVYEKSTAHFIAGSNTAVAQISNPVDSSLVIENIIVKAYENNRRLIDVAAPVSITGQMQLNRFNNMSILPALNITPGVSMEKHSPGSYRLNIRGAATFPPFGVRDVKDLPQ